MGVIVAVRIPAHRFEFGRRLPVSDGDDAEIERVETGGNGGSSLFSLSGVPDDRLEDPFGDVDGCRLEVVEALDGRKLHVIAWESTADPFFQLVDDHDGVVHRGTGTAESWTFETRFPSHDAFASFRSTTPPRHRRLRHQRLAVRGRRVIVIIVSHYRWFAKTSRRTTGKQLQ